MNTSRLGRLTTVAFGVLLAAAVVAGCADQPVPSDGARPPGATSDEPSAQENNHATSTTTALPQPSTPNKVAATKEVAALLAAVPVLPGARKSQSAPVAALARPETYPATDNLVQRTRWWTAGGTIEAAMAYLGTHPPQGPRPTTSDARGVNSDGTQWVTFEGQDTAAYDQPQLVVAVAPDGDGVAMRADGQVIWLPERASAGYLPDDVTSVEVTITQLAPPTRQAGKPPAQRRTTMHRTLPAAPARQLASLINSLPVWPPGTYSCPEDTGERDNLVFHAPQGSVAVTVDATGCATVTIASRATALDDGARVDQLLRTLLGQH